MRGPTILLIVIAALELSACGNDPLEVEQEERGQTTSSEAPSRGTTPTDAGTSQGRAKDTERETKAAKRRLIYLDARTLCGRFGVRQVVRRFRIEPGSPATVARAYSERNYSGPFRGAGYRGCLAGFAK